MSGFDTESPNEDKMRIILTGKPDVIIRENETIWRDFNSLPTDLIPDRKLIELLFNYEYIFSKNQQNSYWLAKKIGKNTCTYCNRIYIFTVIASDEKDNHEDKKYITRPHFDHWFPKSKYPLLSLSLYNLIPSCPICNSSIKGDDEMNLIDHIHPYIKDNGTYDFKFRATLTPTPVPDYALEIDCTKGSKIDNTISFLKLKHLYSHHAGLEVKDLMNFENAYKKGYINNIVDNLFKNNINGLTKKEVYRMIFGVEYDSDKYLDRPLSKLKRDILEQIGLDPL